MTCTTLLSLLPTLVALASSLSFNGRFSGGDTDRLAPAEYVNLQSSSGGQDIMGFDEDGLQFERHGRDDRDDQDDGHDRDERDDQDDLDDRRNRDVRDDWDDRKDHEGRENKVDRDDRDDLDGWEDRENQNHRRYQNRRDDDVDNDWDDESEDGLPRCIILSGRDAGVPYRFTAVTRGEPFVCQEDEALLFNFPSDGELDCAQVCLNTSQCNYIMIFNSTGACQGLKTCDPTDARSPDARVSIYRRKVDPETARRKGAVIESFSKRARARLLVHFDFNEPLTEHARRLPSKPTHTEVNDPDDTRRYALKQGQGQPEEPADSTRRRVSRRRAVIKDKSGKVTGQLWNSGQAGERTIPAFGSEAKFGGFWSFKGTNAGIRVPPTTDLTDYSSGPGATIALVFRKDGYDENMGRIWAGPNIDLYGYTSGIAINMNGIRCLYRDPGLYDNEFHFIFVSVTFATGNVEVYRDDVFLGNGTYGPPIEEFEYTKFTSPWLIGIRYDYDAERPYDGDADEFALFSWHFSDRDRQKFMQCGGACFKECPDTDQALKLTVDTGLSFPDFRARCNRACSACAFAAVQGAVANKSGVAEQYMNVSFLEGGSAPHTKLTMEMWISLAPCTLEEVKARLTPVNDVIAEISAALERARCVPPGEENAEVGMDISIPPLPDYCNVPDPPPNCLPSLEPDVEPYEYFMEPGLHPRVLFTAEDLPTIRARLGTSWVAQESRNTLESMIALHDPGSPYGQMYQKLLTCDPRDLDKYTTPEDLLVNQRNNTEWVEYPDIYTMFMYGGLLALLDEDHHTAAQLGAALACHSTFMNLVYIPEDNNILNEDCEPALGLAYDYLYNAMTERQREPVRQLIANYTWGRVPFGTGMPGWQLGANGVGFFDGVVIQSLAIEGEEGNDVLVFENDVRKQKGFYKWGVFESGFTHEGWHYFMFAMEGAGPALLAAEIRGRGVLKSTSAKEALTGAFYQLSPWTTGEQVKVYSFSDGAGIGSPGRINIFFPIMKRLYPSDPIVDFMYSLQIEHQEDRKMTSDWLIFGSVPNHTLRTSEDVATLAGLSLSRFCPDSGRVVMRSDWSEDGLSVHFSSRMDTYGLQKIHADINSLALFSHRRQWVSDTDLAGTLRFNDEFNDYHSTILIDGLGQSGSSAMKTWPSLPGRIIDFKEHDPVVFAVGDATLAYSYYARDYACSNTKRESCTAVVGCTWDTGIWQCVKDWAVGERAPFNMSTSFRWGETREEANIKTFSYPKFFNGSDRDLNGESEKWREELNVCPLPAKGHCWGGLYNPVRFAFRTVILVRGRAPNPHPYVLVVDDIQAQDELEHEYTISWQVRPPQYHWSRQSGDRDSKRWEANRYQSMKRSGPSEAVLAESIIGENESDDAPEFVVRLVGDPIEGLVNDTFVLLEETPQLEQFGRNSSGYQRLQASRRTVLPRFKTILYPRRPTDPELETSYDARGEETLTIKIGDTMDVFKFRSDVSGRALVHGFWRNNVKVHLR